MHAPPRIEVRDVTLAYSGQVAVRNATFDVPEGKIFFIIGASGSGKTTLLRALLGLHTPATGHIFYGGEDLVAMDVSERARLLRRFGVLYQRGGLFTSMTLFENVALPLQQFTPLPPRDIAQMVRLKLKLVGLAGFESYSPAELSGGMQRRAGLARAMALDPEILFFDEPSSGLDPIAARRLDELIRELSTGLGATVVIVSHDIDSLFALADECVFLDAEQHAITARGSPHELLLHPPNERIAQFLSHTGSPAENA